MTVGPHEDEEKSSSIGHAAHICAASPQGPRYDVDQTPEDRKGIANGIWLCANCATKIDVHDAKYEKKTLLEWKTLSEQHAAREQSPLNLPKITLTTYLALVFRPNQDSQIGPEEKTLAEHSLVIQNTDRAEILSIDLMLNLPELLYKLTEIDAPSGADLKASPHHDTWIVKTTGAGTVSQHGGPIRTSKLRVKTATILPSQKAQVDFRTIVSPTHGWPFSESSALKHYISGHLLYEWRNEIYRKPFLVPLSYSIDDRRIESEPCEIDDGSRSIWISHGFNC